MRPLSSLLLALALAACAGGGAPVRLVPAPAVVAPPLPAVRPAPLGSDWRDWPVTPGDWAYRRDPRGSIAAFGAIGSGGGALLTLRCDRERGMVYLSRSGGNTAPIVIRTSTLVRSLPVQPTAAAPGTVAVGLTSRDPLLDAMAFSRGRFIVEQAGAPPLVVPAWAEVPRITEDCR